MIIRFSLFLFYSRNSFILIKNASFSLCFLYSRSFVRVVAGPFSLVSNVGSCHYTGQFSQDSMLTTLIMYWALLQVPECFLGREFKTTLSGFFSRYAFSLIITLQLFNCFSFQQLPRKARFCAFQMHFGHTININHLFYFKLLIYSSVNRVIVS